MAAGSSDAKPLPAPLGPDSLMWKDFGSYRYHLMLPQAFLVQSAHPVINAGVGQHSVYRTDPWGRAKRSTAMLWPVVYARPADAIRKGRELRDLHRAIKGVGKDGKRYHALDPEAYSWVHVTGFDAAVRMHELFGTKPTPEERARMFEEWRQIGAMLGIRERDIPKTEDEYWKYFDDMIQDRLEIGEVVADLLSDRYYFEQPKPPIEWLPDIAWQIALKPLGKMMRFNTIGTLPERFRERFDIRWTKNDERLFRLYCAAVRLAWALLPEDLRYIPLARRAREDARRHPEAYRMDAETGPGALGLASA